MAHVLPLPLQQVHTFTISETHCFKLKHLWNIPIKVLHAFIME
jgi:hypothetical protein